MQRVRQGEVHLLYEGTWVTMLSTLVAHYPWFFVHNLLNDALPLPSSSYHLILRSAVIGFSASVVSDCVSNVLKVIKTIKQSSTSSSPVSALSSSSSSSAEQLAYKYHSKTPAAPTSSMTYINVIHQVLEEGGLRALFGRGLKTRLLSNALQSVLFTVVWKLLANQPPKPTLIS